MGSVIFDKIENHESAKFGSLPVDQEEVLDYTDVNDHKIEIGLHEVGVG